MRIGLVGYGKMGKTIEKIATERGHQIVLKIDVNNSNELELIKEIKPDVVIEFSSPHSAYKNLEFCMQNAVPTVCGTTGWLERRPEIENLCSKHNSAFFYASNYSIGVNLFFKLNKFLAGLMKNQKQYEIFTSEIHHTEKLDAPSGTAITLAEGIIENIDLKTEWINNSIPAQNQVPIWSSREGRVPGTHTIKYVSEVDEIEIKHTAYARTGFALGAVIAAEWLQDKKGVFGMDDMLNF